MTDVRAYEADSRPIDELLREVQPPDEFLTMLTAWQRALGMDQEAFAAHLGYDVTNLSRVRKQSRRVSVALLEQVLARRPQDEEVRWLRAFAAHLRQTPEKARRLRRQRPGATATPLPSQEAARPMAAAS
jgi:hypothetical protein